MKCTIAAAGVLTAAALASGCTVTVDSQGQIVREETRFTVQGAADLRLTTFDGSIRIHAWDRPDIVVEVEKRGSTREAVDALEVRHEQKGNLIEFEVRRPRAESFTGVGFYRTATARLIVSVPRSTNIRARSGDGSIAIEGVSGTVELRTGDGSIRATSVSGNLTLNTGDGSVAVDRADGQLDLETGDGSVNVSGRLETVRVHTGDGSVIYRAQPGSTMAAPWTITTGDGSVTMYLPREFGAELDAYTGDGGIRNDLEWDVERPDGREARRPDARRTLRGRLGEGGHQLRIRTGDGAIRLRPS